MNILVVGCNRLGSALAHHLSNLGHQVTIIDQSASSFDILPADFHGRVIEGDVLTRDVLHRAEIETAEAVVAVTNSDTLNAVVAHIAESVYNISNVVVRNYDPRWQPFQDAFGLQIVSSVSWGIHRITDLIGLPEGD
jgi:trk system potassium uptake protein TrkA